MATKKTKAKAKAKAKAKKPTITAKEILEAVLAKATEDTAKELLEELAGGCQSGCLDTFLVGEIDDDEADSVYKINDKLISINRYGSFEFVKSETKQVYKTCYSR